MIRAHVIMKPKLATRIPTSSLMSSMKVLAAYESCSEYILFWVMESHTQKKKVQKIIPPTRCQWDKSIHEHI